MNATRGEFLHDAFLAGVTAMVASRVGSLAAAQADGPPWQSRIGLELYTVVTGGLRRTFDRIGGTSEILRA
jgi:hypothetical protein